MPFKNELMYINSFKYEGKLMQTAWGLAPAGRKSIVVCFILTRGYIFQVYIKYSEKFNNMLVYSHQE
jgi:hypothetical protein